MNTSTANYYTRKEAADLSGVSVDTIKRRHDEFEGVRRRPGDASGTWEIPLTDLIRTGLYRPDGDAPGPDEQLRQVREHREVDDLRRELVALRARHDSQTDLVEHLKDQVTRLNSHIEMLVGGGR